MNSKVMFTFGFQNIVYKFKNIEQLWKEKRDGEF
jgi:hypothetical protein